jgi:hypothetical protein
MEYEINASSKLTKYIEAILPSMLNQLGLTSSRKYLYIKVDKDIEHEGECVPLLGIDTFLVVIKPNKDLSALGVTLAHELTHVAQFAKGILRPMKTGSKWKGKFYSRKTAYLDMPWEIQAFAKQEIVFRRAIEEI